MLEKTLESPLDCKEIQPVHPKGDQSWVFTGRTDVEAETPILWPPDVKNWLIWKDTDAGKDWGQEEKGMTEDKMVGWHHRLNGHGFGWTLGVGDGQGGLVCCGSWGHKESEMSERLNWTDWQSWTTPCVSYLCLCVWIKLSFEESNEKICIHWDGAMWGDWRGGGKVQEPQWFGAGTAGKSDSNFQGGSVSHLNIPYRFLSIL